MRYLSRLALMTLMLLPTAGPTARAAVEPEQYVGITNAGSWISSRPMERSYCEQYVAAMVRDFMRALIGPGDSMVQTEEVGVYRVTWEKDPTTTYFHIFKCVPILPSSDPEVK